MVQKSFRKMKKYNYVKVKTRVMIFLKFGNYICVSDKNIDIKM